jgi:hypothetical protein
MPVISNLCLFFGILILNWSVADTFFWFWFEFALAGITSFILLTIWSALAANTSTRGWIKPAGFLFAFLLILFYATLFSGIAFIGEWKSWYRFPDFVATKYIELGLTFVSFFIFFVATLSKRFHGVEDINETEIQFGRRSMTVLGLYAILMFQYHWTGAHTLDVSPAYLKEMGIALVSIKVFAEAGFLDRLITRRVRSNVKSS